MNDIEELIKRSESISKLEYIYEVLDKNIFEISKDLNVELTYEQIDFCKNLTNEKLENLNKSELIYGEINRSGVEQLFKFIKSKNLNNGIFYDIGSGNGKLILHLSLISNFEKLKGVEIDEVRFVLSNQMMKQLEISNVEFINKNVLDIDLSDADVIFMNDVVFPDDLAKEILNKIKKGTHIITFSDFYNSKDIIDLDVSWIPVPIPFRYYIK